MKSSRVSYCLTALLTALTLLLGYAMPAFADSKAARWLGKDGADDSFTFSAEIAAADNVGGSLLIVFAGKNEDAKFAVRTSLQGEQGAFAILSKRASGWKTLTGSEAALNPLLPVEVLIVHTANSCRLIVRVSQGTSTVLELTSEAITVRNYLAVVQAGIVCEDGRVSASRIKYGPYLKEDNRMEQYLNTHQPDSGNFYRGLAQIAAQDILDNFWVGSESEGHILPTWNGFPGDDLPDSRGGLWEAAMLYFCLRDIDQAVGEGTYMAYLRAEAQYVRSHFSASELEHAGGNQLWASDDCAWNAMLMLSFYQLTGDEWFLLRVEGLLDSVLVRWHDPALGGLRYKDGADFMSLYEVGITLCWLRLWEITADARYYELALQSYENMHAHLGQGRTDGLYFCEANAHWPIGEVKYLGEAGSTAFLAGNLGMAALSARFYRLTGEARYLERTERINEGLLRRYVNAKGVFINDRDAWTNGTFTAFYVSEVLTLPGTEELREAVYTTARSIAANARTEDGYYGGSWDGPAEGGGSAWYQLGSVPQQSKTTGSTVLMLAAAALLEANAHDYIR